MHIHHHSNESYIQNEFRHLDLKDKRLVARTKTIAHDLLSFKGSHVRAFSTSALNARAAYDYFSNPKVQHHRLIQTHQNNTVERLHHCPEEDVILAIHDTSAFNFTSHDAKVELGRIGKGRKNFHGILQHTCLAITPDNNPLGLLDMNYYDHDQFDSCTHRGSRPLEEKCTVRWVHTLQRAQQACGERSLIHIADREGDFYDFLNAANPYAYIVRVSHRNRYVYDEKSQKHRLCGLFDKIDPLGRITVTTYDTHTHQFVEQTLTVEVVHKVQVPRPNKHNALVEPIECHVVRAYNDKLEWFLYTNLAVESLEKASKVLHYYRCRWHIESYFKCLKTGLGAEQIELHASKQCILNLLTMLNIMCVRLYWITFQARHQHDAPAVGIFTEHEIHAAQTYLKVPLCLDLSVREAYFLIARLGGHSGKISHTHYPGPKTMTRALQTLYAITRLFDAMSTKT